MLKFKISAFADEYSPMFDEQLVGLRENGVSMIEIRGLGRKSIADVDSAEAKEIRGKLDGAGISVSSIGSPIGKIKLSDDFDAHLEKLRRCAETAAILDAPYIRMFSFYGSEGSPVTEHYAEVEDKLGKMLDIADGFGVKLCHENEKGIYGDVPERCAQLYKAFAGRLGCVFDHANFIQSGATPFPDGFELLSPYITYMHIKDALENGMVVPAGQGIGRITETLRALNARDGEIILSVEPHLRVFRGLSALEGGERTKLGNAYETSAEAFAAAVSALRECIAAI